MCICTLLEAPPVHRTLAIFYPRLSGPGLCRMAEVVTPGERLAPAVSGGASARLVYACNMPG